MSSMATQIKVEIMKRETIKPSKPTPPELKFFKLSLIDQLTTSVYTPLVMFYAVSSDQYVEILKKLKASLSETLTHFYPLAGRIKDNLFIECVDDGVEYTEARISCNLSDVLRWPDPKVMREFLPIAMESEEAVIGCLLLVQVSFFRCGGMAIGLCVSHKLADASTLSALVKFWAGIARGSTELISPVFTAASIFPPMEQFSSMSIQSVELKQENSILMKRFVFDSSKIAALKAQLATSTVPDPTRVEAVSTLLWKCVTAASRTNRPRPHRPSVWSNSVNLRKRFVPPLPETLVGNCLGFISSQITDNEELESEQLLTQIRKEIRGFGENYAKKLQAQGNEEAVWEFARGFGEMLMNEEIEFYICTSWCRFGLYEANFGFGKPKWLSIGNSPFKNTIVLMDTSDGDGIEAWVSLREEDMACFASNRELLEFASFNPSVCV